MTFKVNYNVVREKNGLHKQTQWHNAALLRATASGRKCNSQHEWKS